MALMHTGFVANKKTSRLAGGCMFVKCLGVAFKAHHYRLRR